MSMKKEKKTVVGTCRAENHAWIADRRLYNLPLPKDGTGAGYASVTHIVVYGRDLPALAFANYILINDERRPSAREMLRIQGFPDEFKIVVNYGQVKHQTGNSVAVPVIRAVAERVVEELGEI